MPAISDPGFLLAREARKMGIEVVVLPGASSVLTALVASGLPPEPFAFLGYVPATSGRRISFIETVSSEPRTVVIFEVPHRIHRTLKAAETIWGERPIALLRELTKVHEECIRGTAAEVLAILPERVRGEIVLVVGPISDKVKKREPR
jgi:16S rRNA (cytidine1402-2'-O)-methyltransferase